MIEKDLKALAIESGIKIQQEWVQNPKALLQQYPTARCIIAADGANSLVRKSLFQDQMWFDSILHYTVLFKYRVEGSAVASTKWQSGIYMTRLDHVVSEHVGKMLPDGTTLVTLQLFVDRDRFRSISGYNFKNPATLDDLQTNLSLQHKLAITAGS